MTIFNFLFSLYFSIFRGFSSSACCHISSQKYSKRNYKRNYSKRFLLKSYGFFLRLKEQRKCWGKQKQVVIRSLFTFDTGSAGQTGISNGSLRPRWSSSTGFALFTSDSIVPFWSNGSRFTYILFKLVLSHS